MRGQPVHDTRPHAQYAGHGCIDDLTIKPSCISQPIYGSLMYLAFFDMLSMGIYTRRHRQTSGRMVQELNVCTILDLR